MVAGWKERIIPEWKARLLRRVDGERRRDVCARCRHYRRCVAAGRYCPPYGLASRWRTADRLWLDHGVLGGMKQKEEIVKELLEYKKEGWNFTDFCEICNFRCKVEEQKELRLGHWDRWDKYCCAIDVVVNEIPCLLGSRSW